MDTRFSRSSIDSHTIIFGFRRCKRNDGHRQKSREEFSLLPAGFFLFLFQATSPVYSKVIIAMADRAKAQRNASAAPLSPEDSEMKYFCRSWLIQLGFGGPEHKEDRRVLLGHLHGFAAFRTADKMDAHKAKLAAKRGTRRAEDIVPEVTVHDPD